MTGQQFLTKNCLICNRIFQKRDSYVTRKAKYCSLQCAGKSRTLNNFTFQHSEEAKNKIALSMKQQYKLGERKSYGMFGKHHSEETKRKISESNMGKKCPYNSGENAYNWKGGISYTKEYERLINQKRHSRVKAGGKLSIATIQLVYEDNIKKYGTLTCYLCEKPVPFKKDHLEHKIPLSRDGTNEYNNLAIACQKCNIRKHTKTEAEYRETYK